MSAKVCREWAIPSTRTAVLLLRPVCYGCCYQCPCRFQLSRRVQTVNSFVNLVASKMHSINAAVVESQPSASLSNFTQVTPVFQPCFEYTETQKRASVKHIRIADLVKDKTSRGEFFFGIEITHGKGNQATCVDFNIFLPVMPTFISILWMPIFVDQLPMNNVASLRQIRDLEGHIPAMPHLSIYRLTKELINEFLDMNITNLLAIRGDKVDHDQQYKDSHMLVEHARQVRGAGISIAVAGHPQGYVINETFDKETSLINMKKKVEAGADFIITQLCYTPETIVEYIRELRCAGVNIPIMVGVVVPENYMAYQIMTKISHLHLPADAKTELDQIKDDDAKTRNFFIQLALRIILHVRSANLGVQGIQFFSMNRFGPVIEVLTELRRLGILKETAEEKCNEV